MIYDDAPELYEDQLETMCNGVDRPTTGVRCRGALLTNSLEDAEFPWGPGDDGCGQLRICSCGIRGCEIGGYVQMYRTDRYLLWTRCLDPESMHSDEATVEAIEQFGPILMPWSIWLQWCDRVLDLDPNCPFPTITWQAITHAWVSHHLFGGRLPHQRYDSLLPFLDRELLACDTLAIGDALAKVNALDRHYPSTPVSGEFFRYSECDATPETLYFNGPKDQDWTAFAWVDRQLVPSFDKEWVFVPVLD